jgi:hypothetical protein
MRALRTEIASIICASPVVNSTVYAPGEVNTPILQEHTIA